MASAPSPAPGMNLLISTRPSRITYISVPASPSWNSDAPGAKRFSLEKAASVISSLREIPCSRKRRILSVSSILTAAATPRGRLARKGSGGGTAAEKRLRRPLAALGGKPALVGRLGVARGRPPPRLLAQEALRGHLGGEEAPELLIGGAELARPAVPESAEELHPEIGRRVAGR